MEGFRKASARAEADPPGHALTLSFDPDKTPLFFVAAKKTVKSGGGLPMTAALAELAHSLNMAKSPHWTCPAGSDGLYYCGRDLDRFFAACDRLRKKGVSVEAELTRPKEPLSAGVPSGVLHEMIQFIATSVLFESEWCMLGGRFVLRNELRESVRAAVSLSFFPSLAGTVRAVTDSCTLKGAGKSTAMTAEESTRFALPNCRPVRVVTIGNPLDVAAECLASHSAMTRYWRALYGHVLTDKDALYATVSFGEGGATLTYPANCLAASSFSVDDKHRPAHKEREDKLAARLLADLRACSVFRGPARED